MYLYFMKYFAIILLAALCFTSFTSCNKEKVSKVPLPDGYYEDDWNTPLSAAQDYDRNIFVQFYADWCTHCATFKKDVLNDPEVESYMKANFVPVLLDDEKSVGKDLLNKIGLSGHPLSVMFDKDGNKIGSHLGKMNKSEFLEWIKPYE